VSGLVLYGPPASGKDTLTAALARLDGRFRAVGKVKTGSGRTSGYRMVSPSTFDRLLADGLLVGASERYGNRYAVDRRDVTELVGQGCWPTIHSGRMDDLERLVEGLGGRWFTVLLWCGREETARRSRARCDRDTPARLDVWDSTLSELLTQPARAESLFDLVVRTDLATPEQAAHEIARGFHAGGHTGVHSLLAEIAP
jgi:guanylate kinase